MQYLFPCTMLNIKSVAVLLLIFSFGLFSRTALQAQKTSKMANEATEEDVQSFIESHPGKEYFVFPESRSLPIQMYNAIPEHWCNRNGFELENFAGEARPGEFYTFQLGIYCPSTNINNIRLNYSDLINNEGQVIGKKAFRCFNLGGVNEKGAVFTKVVNVPQGNVQPLWVGIQIPEDASGYYNGDIIFSAENVVPSSIHINLNVSGTVIADNGFNEAWRMARLKWLDSDIAIDDSITKPYAPLEKEGLSINLLGRSVTLQKNGLPGEIQSCFSNSVTKIEKVPRNILASPFQFVVEKKEGSCIWENGPPEFTHTSEGKIKWVVKSKSDEFKLDCEGKVEYDGFMEYKLALQALEDIDLNDIQLEIPLNEEAAKYLMGLGNKGGLRPRDFEWKWNIRKYQDAVWIGDVNAGLRCKFKGGNYKSPLVNIYYEYGPLNMPESWGNDGKGGIRVVEETPDIVLLEAFSGERTMKKGDELHFNFELLLTPLKPINISEHFTNRYIHKGTVEEMLENAEKYGINVINVHHSKPINPFINYPYFDETVGDFREYIKRAHTKNLKVKPYYTTREITVNAPEFWALWSLDGEIIYPGPGKDVRTVLHKNGPDPWLIENLQENFIPAWVHHLTEGKFAGRTDLSVITTPDTRWNNFYVEGLDWMVNNLDIDGLYIDDTALGRESFKRIRKILSRNKPGCLVDFHSWNAHDYRAGWNNNANLYMELFPYIDRLWFGESFRYDDNPSDYWLVEISGIPFGLMGEMLQGGGNRWKGMVYGMINRIYQDANPLPVWNFIDKYKLGESEMIGYWDENCPVVSDNRNIKATVYQNEDFSIVALGNFSHVDQECKINIDWESLNLDKNKTEMFSPFIEDFQEEGKYFSNSIKLESDKGLLLVIRNMQ